LEYTNLVIFSTGSPQKPFEKKAKNLKNGKSLNKTKKLKVQLILLDIFKVSPNNF